MDANKEAWIGLLHDSGWGLVVALTGGGASLAGCLLAVPGASRTVLEVIIPYQAEALTQFLGWRPESFCSVATSQALARRALERARGLLPGQRVAGLACTASLRSDRPKRGPHRFHASICHSGRMETWSLTLNKEARTRAAEEEIVDRVMLQLLLESLNVGGGDCNLQALPLLLLPGETIERETRQDEDMLAAFLRGEQRALLIDVDGRLNLTGPRPRLLLPGSFNPLHRGHWQLGQAAAHWLGVEPAFELAVVNADKPPLEAEEVRQRLAQFGKMAPIWLTRAPTFLDKAPLFPGVVFVVGADTAARIVQPRFYQDDEARMLAAMEEIRGQGCRFLVAGRVGQDGKFHGLADLAIPRAVQDLFQALPEDRFRLDISSTELRRRKE